MVTATAYFQNETDAIAYTNLWATGSVLIVGTITSGNLYGNTNWKIGYWSGPGPAPTGIYSNGFDLSTLAGGNSYNYRLYPASGACFKEGTKVLCQIDGVERYEPIETLKVGTLVKTSRDGYKKIEVIKSGTIHNPGSNERIGDRLYKCSPAKYPELKEDLYITGNHSILVDTLTEVEREQLIKHMDRIFITDNKYRLIACVDERAEPLTSEGVFPIWHLALENENTKMNYGIYVNGGLLVETCCIDTLKNGSNMVKI
jgi:hypothetical protein